MMEKGTVRKDEKTGKWGYSINVPGAKRTRRHVRQRGFATKRDAQDALDALRRDHADGNVPQPASDTVAGFVELYLTSVKNRNREQRTITSARTDIKRLLPAIGDIKLQSLTADDLNEAYAALDDRGLSANTRRHSHVAIKALLDYAVKRKVISRNVAADAEPPDAETAKAKEFSTWTRPELVKFLAAAEDDPQAHLYYFAAYTGLREGELSAMHWSDLDLDAGEATVRGAFAKGTSKTPDPQTEGTPYYYKATKGRKRRVVVLDPDVVQVLKRHRQSQLAQRLALGDGWKDLDLVFCEVIKGGMMTSPQLIGQRWGKLVRSVAPALGLKVLRLHDLRHSHCTQLLAAGARAEVVSKRLGHASTAFTLDTYAHVYTEDQRVALGLAREANA